MSAEVKPIRDEQLEDARESLRIGNDWCAVCGDRIRNPQHAGDDVCDCRARGFSNPAPVSMRALLKRLNEAEAAREQERGYTKEVAISNDLIVDALGNGDRNEGWRLVNQETESPKATRALIRANDDLKRDVIRLQDELHGGRHFMAGNRRRPGWRVCIACFHEEPAAGWCADHQALDTCWASAPEVKS